MEAALLEFQKPTIPEAWASLVSAGVQHIHVAPLLLFAAGHAKQDIPEVLAECQKNTPHVSFDQSRPISREPSLIDIVVQRISSTLADNPLTQTTALVMVGRGNRDPCAQADMRILSELVNHRLEVSSTVTAFYAMAEPKLPAVLDQVAQTGRFDQIVVHPHLLFEGRLHQAITAQTEEAKTRHPKVQFTMSAYLGPDRLVAKAIAGRIAMLEESL